MENYIFWTVFLAIAAMVSLAAAYFFRGTLPTFGQGTGLFRPKADRRISVVEWANIDAKRKLVLVRRDDVEHLLMTGGPVDVVVETGIHAVRSGIIAAASERPLRPAAVYGRGPDATS